MNNERTTIKHRDHVAEVHPVSSITYGDEWYWGVSGVSASGGWCNLEGGTCKTEDEAQAAAVAWIDERADDNAMPSSVVTQAMYEARTEDGVGFLVAADTDADAKRQARTHLRDVLTHINPAQRITVTRCDGSGIEWHRD